MGKKDQRQMAARMGAVSKAAKRSSFVLIDVNTPEAVSARRKTVRRKTRTDEARRTAKKRPIPPFEQRFESCCSTFNAPFSLPCDGCDRDS